MNGDEVNRRARIKRDVMEAMRRAWIDTRDNTPKDRPLFFVVYVHGLTNDDLKPMLELLGQENKGLQFKIAFITEVVAHVEVKHEVVA